MEPSRWAELGTAAAEVLLESLAAAGVERLWFCSGSELVPLQEAAARRAAAGLPAVEIAPALHEHVAICAAMGETMVTGHPSAVVAHADLGPLNFGAELHTALRGGYPVLLMSGSPATHPDRRTSQAFWNQQRWDQGATLREYTKWDHQLAAHEPVGTVVARALQVALTAPTGPVYLALPAEVLSAGEVVGGADTPARLGVPTHGEGSRAAVAEIAERLATAERPLLVTERAGRDPHAAELLTELCETYGLGVRSTRHRMSVPSEHPVQLGACRVDEADVVVVLEHHVPWVPAVTAPRDDAWIAVVGQDPLASEIPLHEFPADRRTFAAPAAFLRALGEELATLVEARPTVAEHVRRRVAALEQLGTARGQEREQRRREALALPHLTPAGLSAAVDAVLEPEDLLVDELGDTEELVRRSVPGTLFQNGGSSLGWAMSACVGLGLAAPDRFIVCTTGDGGHLFGLPSASLWAQRRYDTPALTVVANNAGYRTGTTHVDAAYPHGAAVAAGDYTGGSFDPVPDHAAEARAAGAVAFTVTTPDELLQALRTGRTLVEDERRSVVIDALLPTHRGELRPALGATRLNPTGKALS